MKYSLENLHKLWECIAEISDGRQEYIVDLAKTFETIEQDRYVMVCSWLTRGINSTIQNFPKQRNFEIGSFLTLT